MYTKRSIADLDAYIATLVNKELAGARSKQERIAILQSAAKVTRQLSISVVQKQLLVAVQKGAAPKTLVELQQLAGASRSQWMKPVRMIRRDPSVPVQRTARQVDPRLTPGEVARELGVSPKTVTNWCKQGLIRCEVLDSGHRRIPATALDAYRAAQVMWQRADAVVDAGRGSAPVQDEASIFDEIAGRRRG